MKHIVKFAGAAAIALGSAYILSTQGRTGHPGLSALRGWNYAHRGLHDETKPENSMAAFRAALEHGYGIELDIHLMKDGNLAVIHDCSLERVAGADVKITDLTAEDLPNYRLCGTEEIIPTFPQVLALYAGKAPLIIELKADNGNHAALVKTAVEAMEGYEGVWCMESFDPRCVTELKKHYPHIIRGQLAYDYFTGKSPLHPVLKWALKHQVLNFTTRPDFVAYQYRDRKTPGNFFARKFWGLEGVTWTLRTKEEYDTAVAEGWIPIFENFIP
jgi:glycerophosphoryl diester phosphodiesterase